MSELKAVHAFDVYEAYTKTGDDDAAQVYLKSEADKVIAKLENENERLKKQSSCTFSDDCLRVRQLRADYKEACGRLQTANLIKDEQLAATRHSNYKRCLAMAKVCKLKRFDAADYSIPRRKWDFYDKWLKRWLELAERFKEEAK